MRIPCAPIWSATFPPSGRRILAATLRRFWTMLAYAQGGLLIAAALAEGLGVSCQTVGRYLDLLVDLMLMQRLQPWHENVGKRLVKPKVPRGFHLAVEDIKADRSILVHAGERAVPAGDGLRAMPLATAREQLRSL